MTLPDDRKSWSVLALCRPGMGICIPVFLFDLKPVLPKEVRAKPVLDLEVLYSS